jgi:hypothetical protein
VKPEDWFNIGMMLARHKRLAEAAGAFQSAVLAKRNYHQAWAARGTVLHRMLRKPSCNSTGRPRRPSGRISFIHRRIKTMIDTSNADVLPQSELALSKAPASIHCATELRLLVLRWMNEMQEQKERTDLFAVLRAELDHLERTEHGSNAGTCGGNSFHP